MKLINVWVSILYVIPETRHKKIKEERSVFSFQAQDEEEEHYEPRRYVFQCKHTPQFFSCKIDLVKHFHEGDEPLVVDP